ncbi:lytic transglycosylase domain-containing protein [Methylopila musalis]|uniref:Lytic transglycosylase domain-containing protein n=1 Tax=Methylopila musalis TaxID=1134781 RepID=A0ABW3Z8G3_9HYPH
MRLFPVLASLLCLTVLGASAVRAEPQAETPAPADAAPPAETTAPDEAAIRRLIVAAAAEHGVPSELAEAVAEVESGFNPKAVGGVGEIGLMQVLPSTAQMLGYRGALPGLFDPGVNVGYGVRYLAQAWRLTGQDICGTVMKYRAGHGETRYSHLSVAYCVRVRAILAARGYPVTGAVPVATFGAPGGVGARALPGARRLANGRVRMRFNWKAVDARRKTLDRAGSAGLTIAN